MESNIGPVPSHHKGFMEPVPSKPPAFSKPMPSPPPTSLEPMPSHHPDSLSLLFLTPPGSRTDQIISTQGEAALSSSVHSSDDPASAPSTPSTHFNFSSESSVISLTDSSQPSSNSVPPTLDFFSKTLDTNPPFHQSNTSISTFYNSPPSLNSLSPTSNNSPISLNSIPTALKSSLSALTSYRLSIPNIFPSTLKSASYLTLRNILHWCSSRSQTRRVPRLLMIGLLLMLLSPSSVSGIRCYTDNEAKKSNSVECGMNTGCLKIFKKSQGFDHHGKFIPPEKRGDDIQLFRGCFLVSVPDTCFDSMATDLSYCWCSHRDLCNNANGLSGWSFLIVISLLSSLHCFTHFLNSIIH